MPPQTQVVIPDNERREAVDDGPTEETKPDPQKMSALGEQMRSMGIGGSKPAGYGGDDTAPGSDDVDAHPKASEDRGEGDPSEGSRDDGDHTDSSHEDADDRQAPKLSQREQEAGKQLGYTDEELADLTDKDLRAIRKFATGWDRKAAEMGGRLQEADANKKRVAELEAQLASAARADGEGGKDDDAGVDDRKTDSSTGSRRQDNGHAGDGDGELTFRVEDLHDAYDQLSDEKLAQALNRMASHAREHRSEDITALAASVGRLTERLDTLGLNGFWGSLEGELAKAYGTHPTHELPAKSAERAAREELVDFARKLQTTYALDGEDRDLLEILRSQLGSPLIERLHRQTARRGKGAHGGEQRRRIARMPDRKQQAMDRLNAKWGELGLENRP